MIIFQNTHLIGIERWYKLSENDPQEGKEDNGSKNSFLERNKLIIRKIQGEDDP
jgi:hypothetical protein